MTPAHVIQRVKEATDLARLVGEYVPLKKAGTRFIGCCPFHQEKTASFGVNIKGFYKCFGCGASGDAFTFLESIEGIPFHEALKRLADAAGVSLEDRPVSRAAQQWARDEAACCAWWWDRIRTVTLRRVSEALMAGEDDEIIEIIANPLRRMESLTTAQRFEGFRSGVTERDRRWYLAKVAEDKEFRDMWMGLAG